jgi:hypothetical protein
MEERPSPLLTVRRAKVIYNVDVSARATSTLTSYKSGPPPPSLSLSIHFPLFLSRLTLHRWGLLPSSTLTLVEASCIKVGSRPCLQRKLSFSF